MPGDKTGTNLFMCIPPDHMRDDLPSRVQMWLLSAGPSAPFKGVDGRTPVYVGVTDDMGNTVTLPCFDVRYVEGKGIVVMAHRTGRPVA